MSDQHDLTIASAESVALKLTREIATSEKLFQEDDYRKKYLDLYAECLVATRGRRG